MPAQKILSGVVIALLASACFGFYPPTARAAYADGANPAFMILVTTFVRALSLILFCSATGKKLFRDKHEFKPAIFGGFFQTLSIFGIIAALAYIPGPIMIIIVMTNALMILIYMAFKGEEQLTSNALLSTLAALLGLSLVLDLWTHQQSYDWRGLLLAFIAAVATATRIYAYNSQTKRRNPAVVGAENFSFTVLFSLAILIFQIPALPQSLLGYGYTLLASLSLTLGTFGIFYGIASIGAFRFSLYIKAEPVFTAIFSAILLHEVLAWHQYAGMFLVLGSLALYQLIDKRQKS